MTKEIEKPSELSLWMNEVGKPSKMKVDYVQTGADTAETIITFTTRGGDSIKVPKSALGTVYASHLDVYISVSTAYLLDWTQIGERKLEAWLDFTKRESKDLAEYRRLKTKFAYLDKLK